MITALVLLAQIGSGAGLSVEYGGPAGKAQPLLVWSYGDSKAAYGYHPANLHTLLVARTANHHVRSLHVSGASSTVLAGRVASDVATLDPKLPPSVVLLSLGSNNIDNAQATLETTIAAVADAIHAAFPAARVGITRPWIQGHNAGADTAAAAVAAVVAARSWAFLGPDERVDLKGADDGATGTLDGIHASAAGSAALAASWMTAMGY